MSTSRTIDSLQMIRAVAAILVVLFHVSGVFESRWDYPLAWHIFNFGSSGVDIFFVLSGFIIYYTSTLQLGEMTAGDFLLKRVIRIFPIFWISFLGTLGMFLIGKYIFHLSGATSETTGLIEHAHFSSFLASWFLIPNDFRINGVSWTLSFEMVFYLLFGFLFFNKARTFMLILALWAVTCFINARFFHIDFLHHLNGNPLKFFLNPIVAEFFFGCVIAIIVLKYPAKFPWLALTLGIVFFTLSAVVVQYDFARADKLVFFFGVPAALIIYGSIYIKTKIPKILVYLGDASYAIYLFHELVFGLVIKAVAILKLSHYMDNFLCFVVVSVLLVAACCPIHSYIEKPVLSFCRRNVRILTEKYAVFLSRNKKTLDDTSPL